MGGQIKFIVGAGGVTQGKGGEQPAYCHAAELFFAFAHASLSKGGVIGGIIHRTAGKTLAHAVAFSFNAVVEDMGGGVLVQPFKVFGVKQLCPRRAEKLCAHIGAYGTQQFFQAGVGIGGGTQRKSVQGPAVGE